MGTAAGLLDHAEELEPVELDERVEHRGADLVPEAWVDEAGREVRGLRGGRVLEHVVVARSGTVTSVERVVGGAALPDVRAGEANAQVFRHLAVVAELHEVRG